MKKTAVTYKDVEKLWNTKLSPFVKTKIAESKPAYALLDKKEEEEVMNKIINTLTDPFLIYSGPHRLKQWENGWGENLNKLAKEKSADSIYPLYFGKYKIARFDQKFVKAVSLNYERDMLDVIIYYVFDKYLRDAKNIYDFGCGPGYVLREVREVNPMANLIGLDWAKSSQEIIKKMVELGHIKNIKGFNFDFFKPDKKIKLAPNSAVYTVAALEQVGLRYKKFVDYLLKNKPEICIHLEPVAELLDENRLIDNLSIKYFRKRNYLHGYLDYLKKLEKEGKIEIIEARRTYIGSMYIEGHSIIVWKPIK